MIALASLLAPEFPPAKRIALHRGRPVQRDEFLATVAAWRDTLAARPEPLWALYFEDTLPFAAALLGGWQAGKQLLLPGDPQPGVVEWLHGQRIPLLGDLPAPDALRAPNPDAPPTREVSRSFDRPAIVVFTSGTTGRPASIPKSFGQLEREIQALHGLWGDEAGQAPVVASVPHQHFYGLLFKVLWPLCRGAPFVSEGLYLPHEVAGWLDANQGVWVASPVLLTRLEPDPLWAGAARNLRATFSSGGPLPLDAARRCAAVLGRPVREIYGSSETGGVGWRARAHDDCPWQPVPGVTVRVDDEERLCLTSPWLPDNQEWQTADRAERHRDGCFTLRGRVDRIVKIGEKRISLTAIEARLSASALVRDARALLLETGRVGAVVVPSPEGEALLLERAGRRSVVEELSAWLRPHIASVACPRRWRFVNALPQNAMGKVSDEALRALFDE